MHLKDDELTAALAEQVGGETLSAAVYARVNTSVGFTRFLTPIGNYLIARPAAKAAAAHMTEDTGVPLAAAVVLALSATALHVWSADPMLDRVDDYLGHVPRNRITAIEATPGRSWQDLVIRLDGGEEVRLQGRGAAHALAAAFATAAG